MPHTLNTALILNDSPPHLTTHKGSSSKLSSHLKTYLKRYRHETVAITYFNISSLGVQPHSLDITGTQPSKLFLPFVVGCLSIGNMSLDTHPPFGERKRPVVGQRETYHRNGTGIDA